MKWSSFIALCTFGAVLILGMGIARFFVGVGA